jgi:hypothetical protein
LQPLAVGGPDRDGNYHRIGLSPVPRGETHVEQGSSRSGRCGGGTRSDVLPNVQRGERSSTSARTHRQIIRSHAHGMSRCGSSMLSVGAGELTSRGSNAAPTALRTSAHPRGARAVGTPQTDRGPRNDARDASDGTGCLPGSTREVVTAVRERQFVHVELFSTATPTERVRLPLMERADGSIAKLVIDGPRQAHPLASWAVDAFFSRPFSQCSWVTSSERGRGFFSEVEAT